MKFGKSLLSSAVPEWIEFYMNYHCLKKLISPFAALYKYMPRYSEQSKLQAGDMILRTFSLEELQNIHKFKKYFKLYIKNQLQKVETFYMTKLDDIFKKWNLVLINMTILQSTKENKCYNENLHILKEAFLILYKETKLLDDFMTINFIGFRKILKKFEKWMNLLIKSDITTKFNLCIEKTNLDNQQKRLTILGSMIEKEFLEKFFGSFNKKNGIKELRRINHGKSISNAETLFFGFFIGCSIILLILIILLIEIGNFNIDSGSFKKQFPLFRGMSVIISYIWLLGWNVYGWIAYHVDYKLIFEFNHHYSHFTQIWERAAGFTAIFLICFLWFIVILCSPDTSIGNALAFIPYEYIPLICWAAFGIYMIFPFKYFNKDGRMYLLKVFHEISLSACMPIKFRMGWVSDQIVSFVNPLKDFLYLICYLSEIQHDSSVAVCLSKNSFFYKFVFLIALIPQVLRMIQCIKQINDLKKILTLPFFNLIKYTLGAIVSILSYIVSLDTGNNLKLIWWIVFATISTLYSYYWDLKYDWGFLQPNVKHRFLREKLVYHKVSIYYTAMIINLLLRSAWTLSISPDIISQIVRPELFTLIISFLEIFRRSIWNFLRVEKEHVSNCGVFKAVDALKLPYENVKFECNNMELLSEAMKKVNGEMENRKKKEERKDRDIPSQMVFRRISTDYSDLFINRGSNIGENGISHRIATNVILDTNNSFSDPPIILDEQKEYNQEELIKWETEKYPVKDWLQEVKTSKMFIKQKYIDLRKKLGEKVKSDLLMPEQMFSKATFEIKTYKKLSIIPESSLLTPNNEVIEDSNKERNASFNRLLQFNKENTIIKLNDTMHPKLDQSEDCISPHIFGKSNEKINLVLNDNNLKEDDNNNTKNSKINRKLTDQLSKIDYQIDSPINTIINTMPTSNIAIHRNFLRANIDDRNKLFQNNSSKLISTLDHREKSDDV